MPTLHLPAAHTDTDIALAAELASIVGSHELYVTWTHGEGPGLPPEVQAVIHEEHEQSPLTPFAEVLVAMAQGIAAALARDPAPAQDAHRAPRAALELRRAADRGVERLSG